MSNLSQRVAKELARSISSPDIANSEELNTALRLLSKWRNVLIENTLLKHQGTVVMQGPLAGMEFLPQSAEGCHIAKLLGCYEKVLSVTLQSSGFKRVASMKRGAPYIDLWALATKADLNEEELLSLAKNHFTPR